LLDERKNPRQPEDQNPKMCLSPIQKRWGLEGRHCARFDFPLKEHQPQNKNIDSHDEKDSRIMTVKCKN
jgi:hypothetical protein